MIGTGDRVNADSCADLESAAHRLASQGAYEESLDKCHEALRLCPEMIEVLRLRGNLLAQLGNFAEAIEDMDKVIDLRPNCVECLHERGSARLRTGNLEAALEDYGRCLVLQADFIPALSSRSFILMRQKRYSEALFDISRVIALRPGNDSDLHNKAVVLAAMGRYREAIRDYEAAIEINPRSGGSHNNLAWLLATAPDDSARDGLKAVEHARKALKIGMIGAWMDTLAAALAESGDYEKAIIAQKRACRMSQPNNKGFQRRLSIYRQQMSFASWWKSKQNRKSKDNAG
jgi:tetratricopeptide (TPR) repeat protein